MNMTMSIRKISLDDHLNSGKYSVCGEEDEDEDRIDVIIPTENDGNKSSQNGQCESGEQSSASVINKPSDTATKQPSEVCDRTKLIGERLCSTGSNANVPSPVFSKNVDVNFEHVSRPPPRRQQSIVDILTRKLSLTDRKQGAYSKEDMSFINKAHFQTISEISPQRRQQRRKEIRDKFEKWEHATVTSDRQSWFSQWSFIFDPSGRLSYYWSIVVSMTFLYNFWVMIYRFAFDEVTKDTMLFWFTLDYLADLIYILDVGVGFRTGFIEDGVLQTDPIRLRQHYMNCTRFYIDCLCLVPLDFLYLSVGVCSILRGFRLVKIHRFWACLDRTERHTNFPNMFRTLCLLHNLLAIFHWNACFYFIISDKIGTQYDDWAYIYDSENKLRNYLHSFYWSTRALTMIGDLPQPRTRAQYVFCIAEIIFGLFLFATVLGHVANIVTNVSAARKEFQARLDDVKTYMTLRRVPRHLQDRVIRWFDYLWITKKSADEEKTLCYLPDKLKAEIAIHVHLDTLKQVEIFQNTEAGFLCELVLRLRPVLFSPGDHICRKGEVGKEMYIVNRGRVQVVGNDGKTVLATLKAGSYFGEISILNIGAAGNRRTASVKSVGYSDLFRLSKQDLWDVLKEYPAARVRLEAVAAKRLESFKKSAIPENQVRRSSSTPGLLETSGRKPIERNLPIAAPNTPILPYRTPDAPSTPSSCRSGNTNNNNHDSMSFKYIPSKTVPSAVDSPELEPRGICSTPREIVRSRELIRQQEITQLDNDRPCETNMIEEESKKAREPRVSFPHSELGDLSREVLLQEVKRLRERIATLETRNTSLSLKMSQQQWELEHRLSEIEIQITGTDGGSSSTDEKDLHLFT